MTQQTDANDVLMGASGPPAAKFAEPGTTWAGKIVSPPESHQVREYDPDNPGGGKPKVFPSGDPIMGVTVDIQTADRDVAYDNDDGVRRIYLDGRYNKEAVKNAVQSSGAKGLEVGGVLSLTFTHREIPNDTRSRKFWTATYTPAGNAALMGDEPKAVSTAAPVSNGAPAGAFETARSLINGSTLTDAQIAAATSLTVEAVATLRAQTDPPF